MFPSLNIAILRIPLHITWYVAPGYQSRFFLGKYFLLYYLLEFIPFYGFYVFNYKPAGCYSQQVYIFLIYFISYQACLSLLRTGRTALLLLSVSRWKYGSDDKTIGIFSALSVILNIHFHKSVQHPPPVPTVPLHKSAGSPPPVLLLHLL